MLALTFLLNEVISNYIYGYESIKLTIDMNMNASHLVPRLITTITSKILNTHPHPTHAPEGACLGGGGGGRGGYDYTAYP